MKKMLISLFMFLFFCTACKSSNTKNTDSTLAIPTTTTGATTIKPSTEALPSVYSAVLPQLTEFDLDNIKTLDLSYLSPDALEVINITVAYVNAYFAGDLETVKLYLDDSLVPEVDQGKEPSPKIKLYLYPSKISSDKEAHVSFGLQYPESNCITYEIDLSKESGEWKIISALFEA